MKRLSLWIGALIFGLIAVAVFVLAFRPVNRALAAVDPERRNAAYVLLLRDLPEQGGDYIEYLRAFSPSLSAADSGSTEEMPVSIRLYDNTEGFVLGAEPKQFRVDVARPGMYMLVLRYRRMDGGLGNTSIGLRLNGERPFAEAQALELPRLWSDESKTFSRDRYNDESLPQQVPYRGWMEHAFYDASSRLVDPVHLYFEQGVHTVELENRSGYPVEIAALWLQQPKTPKQYSDYERTVGARVAADESARMSVSIVLNAIDYSGKNAYNLRMAALADPAATPFHSVDRLLNIIDPNSWNRAGLEISYAFDVPQDGWYALTVRCNNPNSDFSVFRSIRINGLIPFAEFKAYEFPAQGTTRWFSHTLSDPDGEPYRLYLPAGRHSLSLKAEKEPVAAAARALNMIIAHMNFFGIEIMKVTGRDIDRNRTWRLTDYLPKTAAYLDAYVVLLTDIIADLGRYSAKGSESALVSGLHTALFKLHKLAEKPDELPVYLNDIYSTSIYDRPITQVLGETVNMLENVGLGLDMVYLDTGSVPHRQTASGLRKLASGFNSLLATFTSEKYRTEPSEEVLDIWVTRPITHIDLMQKMADAQFTTRTGIPVRISVMPEPNRLILATAARRTPDIAMGLPSYIPFDLAIRDALLDLSLFEDFWSFASTFSPGAFIPYIMNERVYGMPETLDFHTLVYRQDIFRQLQLRIPDTWQDVIELLPELQRYGMNFYHPIAGGLPTLKWFYQTSPFVYQFGGTLYAPDGLSVNLDDPNTLAGLRYLSELFSLYALQQQVPSFYNSFRFGVIPVGIVDSQTYLQLKYAAPELKGQWAISAYPGIPDAAGQPQRWFIANGVAAVVMKASKKPAEAWEFMKWWLAAETQADFGYRLQSTYGPEYLWFSANLDALAEAPLDPADKAIIIEQVRWQRDVPRTPAQYMLERGLSDIWINSVTAGRSLRTEVDRMIPFINREVTRKMIEFGFVDNQGNSLRPFIVPSIDWVRERFAPYQSVLQAGGPNE